MNIDGHKFIFPEKPVKSVPPLEKVYPPQNSLENKNPGYPDSDFDKEKEDNKDEEEKKRQEKNQLENKGKNIDITI